MKEGSEEKATAELCAVKLAKINAGEHDKACRILAQVSCPSEVGSKGRLRKHSARLICFCIGSKPEEKGLK